MHVVEQVVAGLELVEARRVEGAAGGGLLDLVEQAAHLLAVLRSVFATPARIGHGPVQIRLDELGVDLGVVGGDLLGALGIGDDLEAVVVVGGDAVLLHDQQQLLSGQVAVGHLAGQHLGRYAPQAGQVVGIHPQAGPGPLLHVLDGALGGGGVFLGAVEQLRGLLQDGLGLGVVGRQLA